MVKLRPAALAAVRDAYDRRRAAGSMGRIVLWVAADLADPVGSRLLAELPLDLANALFWKNSVAPGVVRAAVGGSDAERGRFLSLVRDQYFGLPDLRHPYYGNHTPGQVYGNAFDSTLLCGGDADLAALLGYLVPLHLDETRHARAHLQRVAAGGILVIEQVMADSLRWRKIDWLALSMYPYFQAAVATARRRRRAGRARLPPVPGPRARPLGGSEGAEPGARLGRRRIRTRPRAVRPAGGRGGLPRDAGDHRTRLHLAQFLRRVEALDEAIGHCELGRAEGGYEANREWLIVDALSREGRHVREKAAGVLRNAKVSVVTRPDAAPPTALPSPPKKWWQFWR